LVLVAVISISICDRCCHFSGKDSAAEAAGPVGVTV
jgi:hypothetical protein